jgi:hypothetical protein
VGGERPALTNAKLLAYQAVAFGLRGEEKIAVNIAREALKFAKKVPEAERDRDFLMSALQDMCKAAPTKTPVMVNAWRLFRRPFYVQSGVLAAVAVALVILGNGGQGDRGAENVVSLAPAPVKITNPNFLGRHPSFVRPATAPNGAPWPSTASYMTGYKKRNMKGLSSITIDNTQCDSDVSVKLVSINASAAETTARRFYIPAFGQFTAKKLTKGNYRIEYEDLSTGRKYRGDPFEAQEIPVTGGVRFSNDSLTLYKVRDGNANMTEIGDTEFDSGDSDDVDSGEQLVRG